MIDQVVHGKALPTEVVEQVVAKTNGVPLFVEELTKMVLESGLLQEREERYELRGPLPPLAIPATLHDSLTARLDRLATVKSLAQLGATLGHEFSYALLQAVSLWDLTITQNFRELWKELLGQGVDNKRDYERSNRPQTWPPSGRGSMHTHTLWAARVAAGTILSDKRLLARFAGILATFAERPSDAIPQAAGSRGQAKGIYRFLANPRMQSAALQQGLSRDTARQC